MQTRFKVTQADYDLIHQRLIDAGLSVETDIRVWETLKDRGLPAAIGQIIGAKAAKAFKAAPPMDDFEHAGRQFAEVGRTRAMAAGGDKAQVLEAMRTLVAQLSGAQPHAAPLTDQGASSVKTQQAPVDPWRNPDFSDMVPR